MAKIGREKFKTFGDVFDNFTNRNLFELAAKGHFNGLKSPISIGKEANIFSAETRDGLRIVKIYRLETCDFNRMYDYIKTDLRYQNLKAKRREIIFSWAQREYRNLLKAREAGVRVPMPILCKDNILLLEFIGRGGVAAAKVKDITPENPEKFMDKVIDYVRKLYQSGLVHGDLSEFNILNDDENPVLIDFSQGTITKSPNAEELLARDINNLCRFSKKLGIKLEPEALTKRIKTK